MTFFSGSARVEGARFAGAQDPLMQQLGPISAAADFLGNGAIEINMYESEIIDIVRRESIFRQRINSVRATGHPHRYFEQVLIGVGGFSDPRNLNPTPSGPTRLERSVMIKALVNQINLTLFDIQVTQQQGIFGGLEAKDIEDCVNGIIVAAAPAYWTGTDTSLVTPTTDQYVGVLSQITLQYTCAPAASMVDAIKYTVATMMANTTFKPRPTAIYMNPVLGHYFDTEAKVNNITSGTTIVAGLTVRNLETQAGLLPLIADPYLPSSTVAQYGFAAPPTGFRNFFAVVVTENMIERPYISGASQNPNPQLFRLGLQNSLSGQYVAVQFDAIVVKGASYMHAIVAVQRA
jgi:hypothetical protein